MLKLIELNVFISLHQITFMSKPLILVTNDDGINAPGIRTLISVMKEIGDVVVVAPDSPQSGMGHELCRADSLRDAGIHCLRNLCRRGWMARGQMEP